MTRGNLSFALCAFLLVGCADDAANESSTESPVDVSNGVSPSTPSVVRESVAETPTEKLLPPAIVEAYFKLIGQGRGPEAVRQYWDMELFAKRLYGDEFDAMSDYDQEAVVNEYERFMMAIYMNPATAAIMKQISITNLTESRDGDTCSVEFDARVGAKLSTKRQMLQLVNRDGRWRIVDMMTPSEDEFVSRVIALIYKSTGKTPLEYAKSMTAELPRLNDMINRSEEARMVDEKP